MGWQPIFQDLSQPLNPVGGTSSLGLRFRQVTGTTTKLPVLEQLWINTETGERVWRPVPTVLYED